MGSQIASIRGIAVIQEDDKRIHWVSGAAVDADGANGQNGNPFAYRADNKGLDNYANAGWPNQGWTNVLIDHGDGMPTSDGNGNWYSSTTYVWPNRPLATRFVDSTAVAYVVVNPIVRRNSVGIVIGCRARVTYNGKSIDAVVADVSGSKDIGELSIASAKLLGFKNTSPRNGGVDSGVTFELFPDTAAVVNGETYLLQRA
jgi:hypothetical protein